MTDSNHQKKNNNFPSVLSLEQVATHTHIHPFLLAAIVVAVRLQGITGLLLQGCMRAAGCEGLIDGVGTRLPQPPVGSEHSKRCRLAIKD